MNDERPDPAAPTAPDPAASTAPDPDPSTAPDRLTAQGRSTGPTGLGRRRRRLSDAETSARMLRTAVDMVNSAGLTVSLEHISFEDVIREAGVARSAVYRRWPYKDLFFSDLLKELAGGAAPAIAGGNPEALRAVGRIILERLDWLRTPEGRRALGAEVLRQGALGEFELFRDSPAWRTYLALHATVAGLPAGELREELQAALASSERHLVAQLARAYDRITALIGLRLRPDLDSRYDAVAILGSAVIRGLIIMASSTPSIGTDRFDANPFDAPEPASWSLPALGLAGVLMGYFEPDPSLAWDDERIAGVRAALEAPEWSDPSVFES